MTDYRVKICGKYINEDRFMLTYGDAVADIEIDKLVEFHSNQNSIGTVTGVFPPSRFGDLQIDGNIVQRFKEKHDDTTDKAPINGGFFVFKKEFLDLIPDDKNTDLERIPMDRLVEKNQLTVYKHKGFWQCMDTYRDNQLLNEIWIKNPLWKKWSD